MTKYNKNKSPSVENLWAFERLVSNIRFNVARATVFDYIIAVIKLFMWKRGNPVRKSFFDIFFLLNWFEWIKSFEIFCLKLKKLLKYFLISLSFDFLKIFTFTFKAHFLFFIINFPIIFSQKRNIFWFKPISQCRKIKILSSFSHKLINQLLSNMLNSEKSKFIQ